MGNMITKPENMILWLKMDSFNTCVSSACSEEEFMVITHEKEPKQLPRDRGIYRNWGAFFSKDSVIEVTNGGLPIQDSDFTVMVWMPLPL